MMVFDDFRNCKVPVALEITQSYLTEPGALGKQVHSSF